jgi:hypothetical protein
MFTVDEDVVGDVVRGRWICIVIDVAITFKEVEIVRHNYNGVTLYDVVQFCEQSILNNYIFPSSSHPSPAAIPTP